MNNIRVCNFRSLKPDCVFSTLHGSFNNLLSVTGLYSLRIMLFSNLLADARWIISEPVASILSYAVKRKYILTYLFSVDRFYS